MIKFSVVVTMWNEEKSIVPLLNSLAHQTLPADEIILVDAGSHDRTLHLVADWQREHPQVDLKVVVEPEANRSRARNIGVAGAKNEYVAVTDAGCTADKEWLKQLGEGFDERRVDAVAGYYTPVAQTAAQRVFSWYTSITGDRFDAKTFLPSSRSVAFTKKAWKAAGTYPEYLDTCEDLVFARKLKDCCRLVVQQRALVFWEQERSLGDFGAQIARYARGDVQARYWPHLVKILTVWLRYVLLVIFPPLFGLYLFYPIYKHRRLIRSGAEALWLPLVQITADIGVMWGSVRGLLRTGTRV